MSDYASQIEEEQAHVDAIYNRLDDLAAQTKSRLHGVRAQGGKGSPTHMAERDSFNAMYEDRLTQLRAVQDRLVFGKLDTDKGDSRYIGRIGISSEEHEPMLTDWRAEAARPFYEATAQERMGIIQRRHIALKFRNVVGIEDEVLNVHSERATQASREGTLTGEGALLTSLASRRTGFMTDIVANIQAEQDRIIRQPLNQVVVVQGGPGTGLLLLCIEPPTFFTLIVSVWRILACSSLARRQTSCIILARFCRLWAKLACFLARWPLSCLG